uniref:Trehalase n=1 Tax=Anisakis simplex TaxID=6269 RepID=A0A0M3JQS4_ANISI
LLRAVNIHSIFNDSKTFVDMPMKQDPKHVLDEFNKRFPQMTAERIERDDLIAFLNEFFSPPGTELEDCELSDWQPYPPDLMAISDKTLRKFALDLNQIWKMLCRKVKPDLKNSDRHSLIYVPNEFVVPGGRFREYYYWDAYWIIKGLLACGMNVTTKSMLENLASVVDRYGFVPNGGRVYYLERSQPPFLSSMVYEYFEKTHDIDFLRDILPALAKEFHFWQTNRTVSVIGLNQSNYTVYRYRTNSNVPRPESYREDITVAKQLPAEARALLYQNIASSAESGWDFSTRWFADGETLASVQTTSIVPVDLNAIMCLNMDLLKYFYRTVGNFSESKKYNRMKNDFMYAMQYVFYNDTHGAWFDYNIETLKHNTKFYASIALPLFGDCYQLLNMAKSERIYKFMSKSGVFDYPSGVPTSLIDSGQQWDFPNGWSPLNHMIIEGLRKSLNPEMQEQAFKLAQKWVHGNYKVFEATGHMWEKYDVIGTVPKPGVGGEYSVQPGFGWSNGAILDLLVTYRHRMKLLDDSQESTTTTKSTAIPHPSLLIYLTTTMAVFFVQQRYALIC